MKSTDNDQPAAARPAPARHRRLRRWRGAALAVALLMLAYPLVSSLAFEPLLRLAASRWLAGHGGYRLVMEQVRWHPWQLALALRGVSLQAPDGTPLLDLRSVRVDIELASLWRRAVVVADLQLDQPVLHWQARADGRTNWGDFVRAAAGPAPAVPDDAQPLRWWLQHAQLREGRVQLQDDAVPGGLKLQLDALRVDAQDLSTLPGLQGRHTLSVHSETGATVRGTGTLTMHPELAAGGTLTLDGLSLDRLEPLLKPWVDTRLLSGQAAATLAYQAAVGAGGPTLQLSDLGLRLTDLRLSELGAAGDGPPQPWLQLALVETAAGRLAWPARQLDLGRITLAGGQVHVRRDAQGGIPARQALQGRLAPAAPAASAASAASAAAAAPPAPAWRWRVGPSRLQDITLTWRDDAVQPAAALAVTALEGELGALSDDPAASATAQLRLQVASGGRLDLRGQLTPAKPAAALDVLVDGLVLAPAAPYVAQASALSLADGRVGLRGQLQLDGAQWRYRGGFDVQQLRLNERATGDRLLSWEALSSPSVEADPTQLRLGDLALRGLGGRFTIFADGSTNLARVLQQPGRPAQAAAAPAASPPLGGYAVVADRIKVSGGTVDFADLSLALPFGARIDDLGGQIVGIGTAAGAQAQLALEGRVAPAGLARVAGRLQAFDPKAATDLKVLFRNVEMTTLTPYAATFAGRRIKSGTLSLDLQYRIQQGRLQGDNQVVMDRLVLGDKVSAPGTRDLPLDLAIALLQDANGRIDLGLPVSGSLEDPQFALAPLVWKALTGVLVKAATAPFQALAALAGTADGPPLDHISFDPGRADLTPPEREKLARLARALQQRAGLVLTVQPPFDPQADGAALRDRALRRAVAVEAGRTVPAGDDPGPIEVSQPATLAALQRLHGQRLGPALPAEPQALLQALLDAQALPDGALQALARQRADAITRELASQGVDGARLRVSPAAAQAAAGTGIAAPLGIERPA